MGISREATILVDGIAIPRLAFGLGSLMKWAPNHAYPLPTDSSKEVAQALKAGFGHINTGDIYTNNESAAESIKASGIARKDLFFSLKLNTYAALGCKGKDSMVESTKKEIDRFGLQGYVDLLQLHFPPRGHPGNLTNREAWRVLEELKDLKMARIIGLSNWTLKDYEDIMDAPDLKYKPQVNEYELNPFLLFDPALRDRHFYEMKQGIVHMNYGFLSVLSGKLPRDRAPALLKELELLSDETSLTEAELLLSWAYDCLHGIVISSSSREDRLVGLAKLFIGDDKVPLQRSIYDRIEKAAKEDGYEGKSFYKHGHMDAAATGK
ncbi:Aldo/keto reductase [Lophiostoma macrostomum CBS 122681]|uniref:Aldo/keto reductase n=1 Tax=Lophiostoma macrostomum CBS 122681 TaxID=1314788 RepID=A0A6A6SQT8_9PLEO|nr:Aldo/keto reductase [Lophiostoma macrostomum CBS 122681]